MTHFANESYQKFIDLAVQRYDALLDDQRPQAELTIEAQHAVDIGVGVDWTDTKNSKPQFKFKINSPGSWWHVIQIQESSQEAYGKRLALQDLTSHL